MPSAQSSRRWASMMSGMVMSGKARPYAPAGRPERERGKGGLAAAAGGPGVGDGHGAMAARRGGGAGDEPDEQGEQEGHDRRGHGGPPGVTGGEHRAPPSRTQARE